MFIRAETYMKYSKIGRYVGTGIAVVGFMLFVRPMVAKVFVVGGLVWGLVTLLVFVPILVMLHEAIHLAAAWLLGYEPIGVEYGSIRVSASYRLKGNSPLGELITISLAPQVLTLLLLVLTCIGYVMKNALFYNIALLLLLSHVFGSSSDYCSSIVTLYFYCRGFRYVSLPYWKYKQVMVPSRG